MEEFNPWWLGEKDYMYEEWLNSPVRWIPPVIKEFMLNPFSLNFITGPRQIGKTTAIKIFIYENLLAKYNPKAIFYYPCDEVVDYVELGEIIDTYMSARREWGIRHSVIFLDEITFVDEWWRAIKSRIDRGIFKNDVVFITGSASIELLKSKEYFPGRRGFGTDIYFYPLSFSNFVRIFGKLDTTRAELKDLDKVNKAIKANSLFSGKISELFEIYMKTGGFPIPIREYFQTGKISYRAFKTYLDWLRNDWSKIGKSESYMKELISYILQARLSPVSWLRIAKETSINSPNTVRSYIEVLENLFVIKVLNIITPDFKVMYRKNKKIHITDPFLYHTLSQYTRMRVYEEQIVESCVISHLSRVTNTYYWRNKTEIDAIAIINNDQIGFEVKWTVKTHFLPRHFKEVRILDKKNLPLFLASVDWDKKI